MTPITTLVIVMLMAASARARDELSGEAHTDATLHGQCTKRCADASGRLSRREDGRRESWRQPRRHPQLSSTE